MIIFMNKKTNGFSLIELVIVIAIISILLSITVPNYQKYIIKAKLLEVMNIAAEIKSNIIEYYILNDNLPSSNKDLDLNINRLQKNIVENIEIDDNGIFSIKLKNKNINSEIRGKKISFTPNIDKDNIDWTCRTNISKNYLPFRC